MFDCLTYKKLFKWFADSRRRPRNELKFLRTAKYEKKQQQSLSIQIFFCAIRQSQYFDVTHAGDRM